MSKTTFFVPGLPAPKGSRNVGTRKDGTHYTRESSKASGPWVEAVAMVARTQKFLNPPYEIDLELYLPEGKRPKYPYPSTCDVDKMARGCLDGLVQGGLILDDRHVVKLSVSKFFGFPTGAKITID